MTGPVRIPADVDMPDRVLGRLTARQVVILVAGAGIVYGQWCAGQALAPGLAPEVWVVSGVLLAAAAVAVAFGRREGTSLEVLARAAIGFWLRARHLRPAHREPTSGHVPGWAVGRATPAEGYPRAPREGALRLPAQAITPSPAGPGSAGDVGLIDLGPRGWAVIAAASTIPVGLRSPTEQQGVIDCFARLLHAQTGPMQILIRAQHLDLTPALDELAEAASRLTHPALAAAAAGHHRWITALSQRGGTPLLSRQVLVVLREPALATTPGRHARTPQSGRRSAGVCGGSAAESAAAARLAHRLAELERALAPAEITVVALDPEQAAAVLATTADPARPTPRGDASPSTRVFPRYHPPAHPGTTNNAGGRGWAA